MVVLYEKDDDDCDSSVMITILGITGILLSKFLQDKSIKKTNRYIHVYSEEHILRTYFGFFH